MKYIKTFEMLDPDNIKQYIVWFGNNREEILKFVNDGRFSISENGIMVYDYLYYKDGVFKLIVSESANWLSFDSPNVKFMSDDLEECKEYVILHNSINKYNL